MPLGRIARQLADEKWFMFPYMVFSLEFFSIENSRSKNFTISARGTIEKCNVDRLHDINICKSIFPYTIRIIELENIVGTIIMRVMR
jgi:hypothetical protein